MAFFSGILHRPIPAAAAVTVAALSTELPDWLHHPKSSEPDAIPHPNQTRLDSQISIFNISNQFKSLSTQKPVIDPNRSIPRKPSTLFGSFSSSIASPAALLTRYQYAKLAKPAMNSESVPSMPPSSTPDVLYRWHLPDPSAVGVGDGTKCSAAKSQTLVVLLGWLGAKQKHLKRYAEWYTSRGFNVVTFTFPMSDVVSYKVGGRTEQHLDSLAGHLAGWVAEESGKNLVFHTFSNTGWLTYGVILEKFREQDPSLTGKIKGCIVDSAPVAAADPQVWASGFSAAILKKQSVATKGGPSLGDLEIGVTHASDSTKPAVVEVAMLAVLEKFFKVVLNFPSISRRLSDVLGSLSSEQPKCPQLYIYSSSDRVIPSKSVESFIEQQRRAGHEVRACDFVSSPHVDHFRSHPNLYTSQLTGFLEDCVLTCCKDSSQHE